MTLPNPGAWQAFIEENAPQLYRDVTSLRVDVLSEGEDQGDDDHVL